MKSLHCSHRANHVHTQCFTHAEHKKISHIFADIMEKSVNNNTKKLKSHMEPTIPHILLRQYIVYGLPTDIIRNPN